MQDLTAAPVRRAVLQIVAIAALLGLAGCGGGSLSAPTNATPDVSEEHAVITHLLLSDQQFGTAEEREDIFALESCIEEAVTPIGGEHDGNEFGGGEGVLYTYGPDADRLFEAIAGCLGSYDVRPGSYAIKQYGAPDDPNLREKRIELG